MVDDTNTDSFSKEKARLTRSMTSLTNAIVENANLIKTQNSKLRSLNSKLGVITNTSKYKSTGRVISKGKGKFKRVSDKQVELPDAIYSLNETVSSLDSSMLDVKDSMDGLVIEQRRNSQSMMNVVKNVAMASVSATKSIASSVSNELSQYQAFDVQGQWSTAKTNIKKALSLSMGGPVGSFILGSLGSISKDIIKGVSGRGDSGLPRYAKGGIVPGKPNEAKQIVAHGGELIIPAKYKDALLGRLDMLIQINSEINRGINKVMFKELETIANILNYGNSITRLFSEPIYSAMGDLKEGFSELSLSVKGILWDLPKFIVKDLFFKVLAKDIFGKLIVKNLIGNVLLRGVLWEHFLQPAIINTIDKLKEIGTSNVGVGAGIGGLSYLSGMMGPMGSIGVGAAAYGIKSGIDLYKKMYDIPFEQLMELKQIREATQKTVVLMGGEAEEWGWWKKFGEAVDEFRHTWSFAMKPINFISKSMGIKGWFEDKLNPKKTSAINTYTLPEILKEQVGDKLDEILKVLGATATSTASTAKTTATTAKHSRIATMLGLTGMGGLGSFLAPLLAGGTAALGMGIGGINTSFEFLDAFKVSKMDGIKSELYENIGFPAIQGFFSKYVRKGAMAKIFSRKILRGFVFKKLIPKLIPGASALLSMGTNLQQGKGWAQSTGAGLGTALGIGIGAAAGPFGAIFGGMIGEPLGEGLGILVEKHFVDWFTKPEKSAQLEDWVFDMTGFNIGPLFGNTKNRGNQKSAIPTSVSQAVPTTGITGWVGNQLYGLKGLLEKEKIDYSTGPPDVPGFPSIRQNKSQPTKPASIIDNIKSYGLSAKDFIAEKYQDVKDWIDPTYYSFADEYINKLIKLEGFKSTPSPDADGWSIGYGTHRKNREDLPDSISRMDALKLMHEDVYTRYTKAKNKIPNWDEIGEPRKAAIIDWMYNVGQNVNTKWPNTWDAIRAGDWNTVAHNFEVSDWAKQNVDRVKANVDMIRTGKWAYHTGGFVPGRGSKAAILQGGELVIPREVIANNQLLYDTLANDIISGNLHETSRSIKESIVKAGKESSSIMSSALANTMNSVSNTIINSVSNSNSTSSGETNLLQNADLLTILQGGL